MNYKNYNDYELIYSVREKDDLAFDIIFEKYQPIIRKIAGDYFKSYANYGYDYEDFVQEGNIAFQKALIYYDENKNSIFYTFAVLCIRRKLLSFCRKISSAENKISNKELIDIDNCIVIDDKNSISSFIDYCELEKIIKKVLYNLSFEKSSIFELRINGFTYSEIGVLLNLPSSTVEFKNRTARRKLQESLQNYYFI